MKRSIVLLVLMLAMATLAAAQSAPAQPAAGTKTLAATMNVYVFPTKGQDAGVQS
jgi:curli biogenesis system outer membrane secretion channel CsgG